MDIKQEYKHLLLIIIDIVKEEIMKYFDAFNKFNKRATEIISVTPLLYIHCFIEKISCISLF